MLRAMCGARHPFRQATFIVTVATLAAVSPTSPPCHHGPRCRDGLWGGAGALEGTHAGERWGPRRRFFRDFLPDFLLVLNGNSAYCGHAITPCDSLSALLAVSCCTTDRLHSSRP